MDNPTNPNLPEFESLISRRVAFLHHLAIVSKGITADSIPEFSKRLSDGFNVPDHYLPEIQFVHKGLANGIFLQGLLTTNDYSQPIISCLDFLTRAGKCSEGIRFASESLGDERINYLKQEARVYDAMADALEGSAVSIFDIPNLASKMAPRLLAGGLRTIDEVIKGGDYISVGMYHHPAFGSSVIEKTRIGERDGTLPKEWKNAAISKRDEARDLTNILYGT